MRTQDRGRAVLRAFKNAVLFAALGLLWTLGCGEAGQTDTGTDRLDGVPWTDDALSLDVFLTAHREAYEALETSSFVLSAADM